MQLEDSPQLPLTFRRKLLAGIGLLMFAAQVAGAIALAPATTGPANADAAALGLIWAASIVWSAATVLLLIRQADLPDIATASFFVTISAFAAFATAAALHARDTASEVNVVDALFMGVTAGALTALIVWAIAMGAARLMGLPTTAALRDTVGP
jgi:hypothetical protein